MLQLKHAATTALLFILVAADVQYDARYEFFPHCQSIPTAPRDLAIQLGLGVDGIKDCLKRCADYYNSSVSPVSSWSSCQSFAYTHSNGSCVAWLDQGSSSSDWRQADWTNSSEVTSAKLMPTSSCQTTSDCSLNGECSGACMCAPGWGGPNCETVQFSPATREGNGYHELDDGANTSSWGGSVLQDDDGVYHMWASEMVNHCGLDSWRSNSRVVHATSSTPEGPFSRHDVVFGVFAHEPTVAMAPSGEFVMFYTGSLVPYPRQLCNCSDGSTQDGECAPIDDPNLHDPTLMAYSLSAWGPWSAPQVVLDPTPSLDLNLAAVVFEDGSLVGMARTWSTSSGGDPEGSTIHLVRATSWRNTSTYAQALDPLFPPELVDKNGLEDPFVYRDAQGFCHAIFHGMLETNDQRLCGAHAHALDCADPVTWVLSGTAFGNTVDFISDDSAVTRTTFRRRERPSFILGSDGAPTHLVSGVVYSDETTGGDDACFTAIQPLQKPVTLHRPLSSR